ncbi:MAG: thiamine-phosphate kinase [Legionellales bacterium]|nr:thiamine-phosphate kinase [Legionellales bacterium]
MALIGGDTTQGPLSMTLTIHGLVPEGQAVYRHGAQVGDLIYVSGDLGAAALAIDCLDALDLDEEDRALMMEKLLRPEPRIDLSSYLRTFATAAIDISDGLSADLFHLCQESFVGAKIWIEKIPIHPLVQKYLGKNALDFALGGGDDYELCFTVASKDVVAFEAELAQASKKCYPIGIIDAKMGLLALYDAQRPEELLIPRGYSHF